jgi:Co/Zn/Cd efflux system component
MSGTPPSVDMLQLKLDVMSLEGVAKIEELHVFTVNSGSMKVGTAKVQLMAGASVDDRDRVERQIQVGE